MSIALLVEEKNRFPATPTKDWPAWMNQTLPPQLLAISTLLLTRFTGDTETSKRETCVGLTPRGTVYIVSPSGEIRMLENPITIPPVLAVVVPDESVRVW